MIFDQKLKEFLQFVDSHSAFIIVGHKEPDGDCIASCLALDELLRLKGKKTVLLSAGPFKRIETKAYEHLFNSSFEDTENIKDYGLFIADCSTKDRIGEINIEITDFDTFIIDHHKTSDNTCKNCMVDSSAPATAYIVQLLFEAIHGEVTKTAADVLFFGIATDTGFFRFLEEDSADVFEAISRLIKKGASPKKTYNIMTGGKSFLSRKLLGRHLDNAKTYFDGKLIITYETPEDTQNFGQNGRDSDALYQILLAIEGVEAIVNIKQETPEQCTAGFRSIENIDVSVIAAHFGGGGHKNASGASYTSTIDEFIPLILQEFQKIL
ncbi:MAG: bifunctional oligoribonuclease/PAP phosphatase NrnA [Treponema sp.]|nr:bifunctional oligoribonuclease/PAP phosphatase NrnA [Treponema sp.]